MEFRTNAQTRCAIYNIIFYILTLIIKASIRYQYKFYTNHPEINVNHIYILILEKIIRRFDVYLIAWFITKQSDVYV